MSNKIENITTVIEYIENNLNEKLDLTTIADAYWFFNGNCSYSQF